MAASSLRILSASASGTPAMWLSRSTDRHLYLGSSSACFIRSSGRTLISSNPGNRLWPGQEHNFELSYSSCFPAKQTGNSRAPVKAYRTNDDHQRTGYSRHESPRIVQFFSRWRRRRAKPSDGDPSEVTAAEHAMVRADPRCGV